MLSEHWDKYKFHPRLVESGFKGLPKLEAGKFSHIHLPSDHTLKEYRGGL